MHIRNPTLKRGVHISNTLQRWSTEHSCLGRSSQGLGNTGLCGLHQLTCARFQHVGIKKKHGGLGGWSLSLSRSMCLLLCSILYRLYIQSSWVRFFWRKKWKARIDWTRGSLLGRLSNPPCLDCPTISKQWGCDPRLKGSHDSYGDPKHEKNIAHDIYIYVLYIIYISHFLCVCCWTPFQRGSEAKWIAEFFFTWWLTS